MSLERTLVCQSYFYDVNQIASATESNFRLHTARECFCSIELTFVNKCLQRVEGIITMYKEKCMYL